MECLTFSEYLFPFILFPALSMLGVGLLTYVMIHLLAENRRIRTKLQQQLRPTTETGKGEAERERMDIPSS